MAPSPLIPFAASNQSAPMAQEHHSRKSSWGSIKSKIKPSVRARSRERPVSWLLPQRFTSPSLKSSEGSFADSPISTPNSAPPLRSLKSNSSSLEQPELRQESSSSVVSDKSSGQLSKMKQRTKSFLIFDLPSSSSESSSKPATPSNVKFSLSPDIDSGTSTLLTATRPSYRRSHSMNDGPEDKDSPRIPSTGNSDPVTESPDSDKITRQRSKTLNALDQEKIDFTPSILNSLTSFMKKRTPTSRTASSTKLEEMAELSTDDLPPKEESETAAQYLDRILDLYPVTALCSSLLTRDSDFNRLCVREYLDRYFNFENEPIDLSLRKFLMINELPKETQQIDRVIYEFGRHYSAQHQNAVVSQDYCYVLTYSLLMLHTDRFNQNNKRKMAKYEFVDNLIVTLQQEEDWNKFGDLARVIVKAILEYYYDNITYAPFVNIQKDQSDKVLESLNNHAIPMPYPLGNFLNNTVSAPGAVNLTRKRSSTFRWNTALIDPYDYIIGNTIDSLKINANLSVENPFVLTYGEPNPNDIIGSQIKSDKQYLDDRLLNKFVTALKSDHCSMLLKIANSKAGFLNGHKTELVNYGDYDKVGEEYTIARVFKIGMITRQETKLLSNYKSWKRYFCVLTSVGLLFFKNVSLLKMKYVVNSKGEKSVVLEENLNNTPLLESFEPSFVIPSGSFAIRMKKNLKLDDMLNECQSSHLRHCTFYIYGKHSKDMYLVDNQYELVSWINSINCLSALDPVTLSIEKLDLPYEDEVIREVISLKVLTIQERLEKLKQSIETCKAVLEDYFVMMNRISVLTPFQAKTRETLASAIKLFEVKIEWTWFEISRNSMFTEIIERVHEQLTNADADSDDEEFVTAIDILED
ncbi:hypothetical protein OGAPHI_002792 [Ogataea philodendri]|uniref:SEC7 domain-containing protein n=1 Tax=Ogataea philodendri TaxID=1378263 RepID=A0A9P8T5L8_9ASCO|nr:uncharacterized protein OGAPHI_002792 [Ogataea philodendri]KAH3667143.1 hypothetical protein OGAPHI_002792 [Ogataea philodendri]